MNLIEELGFEKCQAIISDAPEWARAYNTHRKHYTSASWFYGEVWLRDIRTAIALHKSKMHSHLTSDGLQGDDIDDCTDIRNHISPLTGVIER